MKNKAAVYFIRHGQLAKPYNDHLTMSYDTLADLALSKLNPGIRSNSPSVFHRQTKNLNLADIKHIYYNNSGFQSRRSLESAKMIQAELKKMHGRSIPLRGLPELKEIKFYVKKLMPRDIYKIKGLALLREKFFQAVLNNGAIERLNSIQKRAVKILAVAERHELLGESVLFVTHDFFMRFLELALKNPKQKITVPTLNKTHLNEYFGGFAVNSQNNKLKFFGQRLKWEKQDK